MVDTQNHFRSPVGHQIKLSASFGELREGHFHHGLDIKSQNGGQGEPVYAVGYGFVSRIKVESTGYGNALYIDHPNGYTSVYAHLKEFGEQIAEYVRAVQYNNQSFEINHFPPVGFLPINKGQVIGKLGNSGNSFGPHLHFEIRETKSEITVNPMLFGIQPEDNIAPVIKSIKVYYADSISNLFPAKEIAVIKPGSISNQYAVPGETVVSDQKSLALSLEFYDQMKGAPNKNGIYALSMSVDSIPVYAFKMDHVSFEESHLIDAHFDYRERKRTKRFFVNCFKYPSNKLSIYNPDLENNGLIHLNSNSSKVITVKIRDFHGNTSTLSFELVYEAKDFNWPKMEHNFYIQTDREQTCQAGHFCITFSRNTVFKNSDISISSNPDSDPLNDELQLGYDIVPLLKPVNIEYSGMDADHPFRSKLCFVAVEGSQTINYGGEWRNLVFVTSISKLGRYKLQLDTIPPKVKPLDFVHNLEKNRKILFKITDNLIPSGRKHRMNYRGLIDGNWVLFEYDQKNDLLTYQLDEYCEAGNHTLQLEVIDFSGNATVFQKNFVAN